MRRTVYTVLLTVLVVVGTIFVVFQMLDGRRQSAPASASMAYLTQAASEHNKLLPMMIEAQTELVSVAVLPNTYVYNNRLVDVEQRDIPSSMLQQLVVETRPAMVSFACSTPETRRDFLDRGVTMSYRYYDKNMTYLMTIDITPPDCSG